MVNLSFLSFFEEFGCCHSHLEYLLSICLAWVNLGLISAQPAYISLQLSSALSVQALIFS
jgi:hypothetical protein